jgi:nucleotide-binding universal stress UspA family protein
VARKQDDMHKTVVVGVDYPPASDAALAWALAAALRRGASLRVVHVVQMAQRQVEALGEGISRWKVVAADALHRGGSAHSLGATSSGSADYRPRAPG